MEYFTQDYIQFFQELSSNNHKEWFDDNRKRYENSVKKPFAHFVDILIQRVQEHDESVQIQAKDAILRINRDIRFSKDKTPYNLHCTAFISAGGRKDKSIPGFFIRFSAESLGIMGGAYGPSKEQLQAIRQAIAVDIPSFRALIQHPDFTHKYDQIRGEQHKRIPKDFQEVHENEPLIANKQFYFFAELPVSHLTQADLADILMEYWHAGQPVNEFLKNAIQTGP